MINHKYFKIKFKEIRTILADIGDEIFQINDNAFMIKDDLKELLFLIQDNCYHFMMYIIQLEEVEKGKQDDLS